MTNPPTGEMSVPTLDEAKPSLLLRYKMAVGEITGIDDADRMAKDFGPEEVQLVVHALAILPHLGPDVTAAFLASAHGQGEHRAPD